MGTQIREMTGSEIGLFAELINDFSIPGCRRDPRERSAERVLQLLRGDTLASYVWDEREKRYRDPVAVNRDLDSVNRYLTAFQFDDPLTSVMRRHKGATLVEQVFPMERLERTDFYNEYLRKDGMYYGLNVFHNVGDGRIVDLRVWRQKSRSPFSAREIDLLNALVRYLGPAFFDHHGTDNANSLDLLSPRESEVAQFVARGCTDRDIAEVLGISFSTVRTHVNRCFEKLDCANRAELSARFSASLSHQL